MSKLSVRSVGQELSEESTAALFAKYSRSDKSIIHEIENLECDASRFSKEAVQNFHSKWTIGFGHRSIAEHAVLHFAIEGLSILAAKALEDTRLASFTEKSTRYVVFNNSSMFYPAHLNDESKRIFVSAYGQLLDGYNSVRIDLESRLVADGVSLKEAKSRAFDAARALLPAGATTGLGMTINASSLERCLNKLLASPLKEVWELGVRLYREALAIVPSLVRHVSRETSGRACVLQLPPVTQESNKAASLAVRIKMPADIQRVLGALSFELWEHSQGEEADPVLHNLLRSISTERSPHEKLPRVFEFADLTASILMDYGSFRDLQRHRMATLLSGLPTCRLGWVLPSDVVRFGLVDRFSSVMEQAATAFDQVVALQDGDRVDASYLVPLGYRVPALWRMNLREFAYVVELRSKSTAHENYKSVMVQLLREAVREMPWILDLELIRGARELLEEKSDGC